MSKLRPALFFYLMVDLKCYFCSIFGCNIFVRSYPKKKKNFSFLLLQYDRVFAEVEREMG